jgi:hypothetical protein
LTPALPDPATLPDPAMLDPTPTPTPTPAATASLATVACLLAAAGLSPGADEVAVLADTYAQDRADVDALYAIPEARYTAPALIFDPVPTFVDWWLRPG